MEGGHILVFWLKECVEGLKYWFSKEQVTFKSYIVKSYYIEANGGEYGNKLYLGFMDLQHKYYRINKKNLWQVFMMYTFGIRHLSGIKSMYIHSEGCVKINND